MNVFVGWCRGLAAVAHGGRGLDSSTGAERTGRRADIGWAALRVAAVLCCGLAGCSPRVDWREIKTEAAGLRAVFPCRPQHQTRTLPLAGTPVPLTLHVCQQEGWTFGVSHADVGDPARVGPALNELRAAAQANLKAPPAAALPEVLVPGMTPQPASGHWRLAGKGPEGQPVQAEVAVFSRGTHVVQATVLGAALAKAPTQEFFEGLRFSD